MDRPLVVHVLWTLGRAGAERVVFNVAKHLPDHGFRVLVIAAGGGGAMELDFRHAGIPCVVGPVTKNRLETLAFLAGIIEKERPALWHTHLGGDVWGGWMGRRKGLHPWIITAHNDDRGESWFKQRMRRWAFVRADQVVCVSERVKTYVKQEFKTPEDRLQVIRNGIDLKAYALRGKRGLRDVPRLISVGRLDAQKDQGTLLKALAPIKRPWTLELVGDGPYHYMLKREAAALGILPRVHFVGSTAHVADRLAEADLFCFPSQWEGQGLALLEAAASGLPAIASDLPVFRETFDESSMLFAKPGMVDEWTKAIEGTLKAYEAAVERAKKASDIVRREFSVERMADEYASLYHSLLGERH